jgi:hypothetical protein
VDGEGPGGRGAGGAGAVGGAVRVECVGAGGVDCVGEGDARMIALGVFLTLILLAILFDL